jgi:hypothetical protein
MHADGKKALFANQPEESRLFRAVQGELFTAMKNLFGAHAAGFAFFIQDQHLRGGPKSIQALRLDTNELSPVQALMPESKGRQHRHTEKLLPQPQVDLALGLRITNCEPCKLSR